MAENGLYIIVFQEDGMATQSHGVDAASVVVNHYDEIDMYCSPQNREMHEKFSVSVYAVPDAIAETVSDAIEDLNGDEMCCYIEALATKNPEVRSTTVDVAYTMEGATAAVR